MENQLTTFTWPATTWLEGNFTSNNGLPGFFQRGGYDHANKAVGELEYKHALFLATLSNNSLYAKWASNIIGKEYSVLNNMSMKSYWSNVLATEVRQNQLDDYSLPSLQPLTTAIPASSTAAISSSSRKRNHDEEREMEQTATRPRYSFEEVDEFYIPGLNMSIGTFIGTAARNARSVEERKQTYFKVLGMNGILDVNDCSTGSQLEAAMKQINDDRLTQNNDNQFDHESSHQPIIMEIMKNLVAHLKTSTNVAESPVAVQFEQLIKDNELDRKEKEKKQLRTWQRIVRKNKIKGDKYERYMSLYLDVIKVHLYGSSIFDDSSFNSEQDYVIKIWSNLVEAIFRETGIVPHWDDTVSGTVLTYGLTIKLDLRLLDIINKSSPDYAIGEFAKDVYSHKYYKDKTKAVLGTKARLNHLLNCNKIPLNQVANIRYPFLLVVGFQVKAYTLRLVGPGLYILESEGTAAYPTTLSEIKNGGIKNVINLLDKFKDLCLVIKSYQDEKNDAHKTNKRKTMDGITDDNNGTSRYEPSSSSPNVSNPTAVQWTRDLWKPK
ncbi:hypothetical protein BDC45DRAFT_564230 [Circinella umbellata]|nr:hypothetical protein BDC45DRAFT_564230 [Circinella umbellata]